MKNKTIIIDGVEYDCETTQLGKTFNEIKIPKGKRLWTAEECIKLHNSKFKEKLNLDDCWFFIKQPFKFNSEFVAGFYADSGRAVLSCNWDPSNPNASLGVRFAKDIKNDKT